MAIDQHLLPNLNRLSHSEDWSSFLLYLDGLEKTQRSVQDVTSTVQELYQVQGAMKIIKQLRSLDEIIKNEILHNKQDNLNG